MIWTKIGMIKRLDSKNKPVTAFLKFRKIDLAWRGQRSKFGADRGAIVFLACRLDLTSPIGTKSGKTNQLDPKNKPVMAFFKIVKIDLRGRGQTSNFVAACRLNSTSPIGTKIGTAKQLDPKKARNGVLEIFQN
ncbi:MAG: hypothetical protein QF389_10520 [Planctomycetota bacterium]|nr:hypothetical protein [Planctomycetota bacterium]